MVIGILQAEILIHDCGSIKDKRRVVSSIKDRLHREHLVSVAEVDGLDTLNRAVVAIACVSRDGRHAGEVLDHVVIKLRALPDAELGDTRRDILYGQEILARNAPERDDDLAREMLDRARDAGAHP